MRGGGGGGSDPSGSGSSDPSSGSSNDNDDEPDVSAGGPGPTNPSVPPSELRDQNQGGDPAQEGSARDDGEQVIESDLSDDEDDEQVNSDSGDGSSDEWSVTGWETQFDQSTDPANEDGYYGGVDDWATTGWEGRMDQQQSGFVTTPPEDDPAEEAAQYDRSGLTGRWHDTDDSGSTSTSFRGDPTKMADDDSDFSREDYREQTMDPTTEHIDNEDAPDALDGEGLPEWAGGGDSDGDGPDFEWPEFDWPDWMPDVPSGRVLLLVATAAVGSALIIALTAGIKYVKFITPGGD